MKKALLILAVILILVIVICAFNKDWIYYRFYPFDRITGEYEISLNGKEINTVEEYYEFESGGKIRLESDTENFKIKGGEYGPYKIGFMVSKETLYDMTRDESLKKYGDLDLSIVYYNTNWWHITSLDIEIDIIQENDEWYVCYELEVENPLENFQRHKTTENKKIKLNDLNNTEIMVGI